MPYIKPNRDTSLDDSLLDLNEFDAIDVSTTKKYITKFFNTQKKSLYLNGPSDKSLLDLDEIKEAVSSTKNSIHSSVTEAILQKVNNIKKSQDLIPNEHVKFDFNKFLLYLVLLVLIILLIKYTWVYCKKVNKKIRIFK